MFNFVLLFLININNTIVFIIVIIIIIIYFLLLYFYTIIFLYLAWPDVSPNYIRFCTEATTPANGVKERNLRPLNEKKSFDKVGPSLVHRYGEFEIVLMI